jgi:acyl-homoserine-lactone acylase
MFTKAMTFVAFCGTCLAAAASAPPAPAPKETITRIYWDQYAVPHIYGADIPTVVRGLGYASMENHAELLLRKIARARGRMAEYFGPHSPDGTDDYVASDTAMIQYGIVQAAANVVANGGAAQRALLQAYCDGVNEYATRHPHDIAAELRPILPMVPTDSAAIGVRTVFYDFEAGQNFVPQLVQLWLSGGGQPAHLHQKRQAGSNAIVIAPAKSADGNAIIVNNSHLPWGVNSPATSDDSYAGATQFLEAHLTVGNPNAPSLNAAGANWPGLPFLVQGFNDFAGWTNTANTIYNADLFELTLDSTGRKYLFGGAYRNLDFADATIKIRDGAAYKTQIIHTAKSVHGPVLAFNATHTKALAVRLAGILQTNAVTQYWNMLQAQNLSQFKTAVAALQVPLFNFFFADRAGEIYYLFNGRQPVRNCPFSLAFIDGVLIPPIEDGTKPGCLWTKTLRVDQLPQASNPPGGYFANGNEAPWYASFPQPPTLAASLYPPYITADGVDFRPRQLHTWLNSAGKLTAAQVLAGKNSTYMTLTDGVLPDLLKLAGQAAAQGDKVAAAAAATLSAWDRTGEETSVGGTLFEEWWEEVAADTLTGNITPDQSLAYSYNPHPKFTVPFDPANPLTTPNGLDPSNNAKLLADLDHAYGVVSTNFASNGGASVPWGVAHKTTLVNRYGAQQVGIKTPFVVNAPLSGTNDEFGALRIVDSEYAPPLGQFIGYDGESYVDVIEFTPKGAVGGSIITYGNASRPNSPHVGDQAALFRAKTLKPELRSYTEVKAASVRSETY